MKTWQCSVCCFIYDESLGLPAEGILAGIRREDIPAGRACPDGAGGKAEFTTLETAAA